jgi:hypothetical protein
VVASDRQRIITSVNMDHDTKVAIATGSALYIGRPIALNLAREGFACWSPCQAEHVSFG